MQTLSTLMVRAMRRSELRTVLDWAAAEGWNPGRFDAEPFWSADSQGFFLADSEGEAAGSIAAAAYDASFGFVGLYLVRPKFRGGRFGVELGRAALDYLGRRTIGLDGVLAKQKNYQRLGFQPAYRTVRYEGAGRSPHRAADSAARFVELRQLPLAELAAYDEKIFPAPRPGFLEAWVRQPGTLSLGVLGQDRLVGYGVARLCRVGYKIGPLAADDPALAEVLLEALVELLGGETFSIDAPEPNRAARALVERYRMRPVFQTLRMYRGPAPEIDLDRVFGVTSLELG